jgi:putative DNA primase/helicase
VPFNVVIPEDERDGTLDSQLQLEADSILSWVVARLKDYLEHGLNEPHSVRVATDNYQREGDVVGRSIGSCPSPLR